MWEDELKKIISQYIDVITYKGNTGRPLPKVTIVDIITFIKSLLKEQREIDMAITKKIALAAYERDFTTQSEVKRAYALAPKPTGKK